MVSRILSPSEHSVVMNCEVNLVVGGGHASVPITFAKVNIQQSEKVSQQRSSHECSLGRAVPQQQQETDIGGGCGSHPGLMLGWIYSIGKSIQDGHVLQCCLSVSGDYYYYYLLSGNRNLVLGCLCQ